MWFNLILVPLILFNCDCIQLTKNSDSVEISEFDNDIDQIENVKFQSENIKLLVEKNSESFKAVLKFIKYALAHSGYENTNFSVGTFNASGVLLDGKKYVNIFDINSHFEFLLGQGEFESNENSNASLAFFALLHTAQVIPENSTIIIFVNDFNKLDTYLRKYILNIISEKNITVYAVINNEESIGYEILKEIVLISGGKVLKITPFSNFIIKNKDVTKSEMMMQLGANSEKTNTNHIDKIVDTMLSNFTKKYDNNEKYVTEIDITPDAESNTDKRQIQQQHISENIISSIFGHNVGDMYPIQTLVIEVGLGSEVITSPLKTSEIYFEVTNTGTSTQTVSFSCSDTKRILYNLSVYRRELQPQESTTVVLYLRTTRGSYQDEITFWAKSESQVYQKKVLVNVGSQVIDQTAPELNYKYTSDCTGFIFSKCSTGTWTLEITAKDSESGLLHISSLPKGIYFPQGYTSGTTDTVTGYYSDTCCKPDLQISAVDRMNNKISYTVNAYNTLWSPGAIAALVLGILLFIILIAVIVYFVIKKRKQQESYDLPRYKGGGI